MQTRLPAAILFGLLSGATLGCQQSVAWPALKHRIRAEFPRVQQISTDDLHDWLDSGTAPPLLLDVREEAEYQVSHLSGAVRIDPEDRYPELPADADADTPIVTYCSVGYRSSAVAERLMAQGYTAVSNLEGSIFEWANRGLPVVRDDVEVREVHPYDSDWGRLLDAELRAYSVE